ncbi:DUF6241 domain-containing protein [Bacillus sp. 2205SS5-2]|uniref:DUF6241 domain-containing protein n=1 Tax=Bacillus sp. 2205SS5-2 TaxID=3109031 RepID=UPI0030057A6A
MKVFLKNHALLFVVIAGFLSIVIGYYFTKVESEKQAATEALMNEPSKTAYPSGDIDGVNPFSHAVEEPISEKLMKQYIHAMSHQKVKAEKWSFYLQTEERIAYLLQQLEMKKYANEETYLAILHRWEQEDFSKVVQDHNDVWYLLGGTVGKATDVLSAEQEESYIASQKNNEYLFQKPD